MTHRTRPPARAARHSQCLFRAPAGASPLRALPILQPVAPASATPMNRATSVVPSGFNADLSARHVVAEDAPFALSSCTRRQVRVGTMPDFNLLLTLDVLLSEGSVAKAARRLRLSPSAMSRALARLRATTGDPLLVRAGRGLVPTPRALALRGRVGPLVQDAEAVLRPAETLDLARLV